MRERGNLLAIYNIGQQGSAQPPAAKKNAARLGIAAQHAKKSAARLGKVAQYRFDHTITDHAYKFARSPITLDAFLYFLLFSHSSDPRL